MATPATVNETDIDNSVKPVFFTEFDFFGQKRVDKGLWLSNEEVFKAIRCQIKVESILGVQRIRGGLWRLYTASNEDRVKLLSNGISLRNKTVVLKGTNPYKHDNDENLKLRVCDLPLSADDSIITQALLMKNYEIVGDVTKEKLRVDGKLTNCNTGDRFVYIKRPSEPLHRELQAGRFKVRVYHYGQVTTRSSEPAICGRCLGEHSTAGCMNDWVCRGCKGSGHKILDCPNLNADTETRALNTRQNTEDLITNSDNLGTAAAAPVTDSGKGKNLSVPDSATAGATPEPKITRANRKKAKSKIKKSKVASGSIKQFFTDSASAGTPCQRDKPQVVRSPPTPAEILNNESKKTKNQAVESDSDGSTESEYETQSD
ncbi:MAG: hypothetical protein AB2693_27685 [Candidatus Thiodiazotropha sp.]